jgi:tRNA (guanine-N7-)-methyltransferase
MGEATAEMAAADPTIGIVALEIHRPGIGSLLWRIDQAGVTNVRIIHDDVMLVLPEKILDESIDEIRIYFPDPWPKLRHHKRRLLQGDFLNLLAQKLRSGGLLHIATDWQPYADWIAERMDQVSEFSGGVVPRPANRTFTRFEKQGLDKEHQVTDFHYFKKQIL